MGQVIWGKWRKWLIWQVGSMALYCAVVPPLSTLCPPQAPPASSLRISQPRVGDPRHHTTEPGPASSWNCEEFPQGEKKRKLKTGTIKVGCIVGKKEAEKRAFREWKEEIIREGKIKLSPIASPCWSLPVF